MSPSRREAASRRLAVFAVAAAAALLLVALPQQSGGGGGGGGVLSLLPGADAKTLERDVFALIALYQEVKDRSPEWAKQMSAWPIHTCSLNGTCAVDPCGLDWEGQWPHISCRYQWDWDPSLPRVVTNFHMPKMDLGGPLPKALALFGNITELDMDTNQLTGPLPAEWGCLDNLIEIDFSKNRLSGTIPHEWGLLERLTELELDGNSGLGGCIPAGAPPPERLCGGLLSSLPCPAFTTDRVIGTATSGTRISRDRCSPYPGGKAALAAQLRCPRLVDFRDSILAFFGRKADAGSPTSGPITMASQQVGPTSVKLEYIPDSRTPQRSFLGGLFGGSSSSSASATRKQ
ncbi:hypothetical protein HYH02_006633 [Chlamydomonas schloesseri]|uniref:Leucine-rich repeat-containing N-terminal plant-type domain-containing protein n=1 Tax=Chlamydomonas schloesseri TaxID=2026947 RepID=A0A835T7Z4_9CHLO|nr:hypothetical protein HYH02_006633 [Chlamydomonas schloesseri]|eukprot:KAG2439111.1 hypothetical protein HYH02_006633 [Chlamydomonas schloesseri]